MEGYNNKLIKEISAKINIPIIAAGGCGEEEEKLFSRAKTVAAGSLFYWLEKHYYSKEYNETIWDKCEVNLGCFVKLLFLILPSLILISMGMAYVTHVYHKKKTWFV